MQTEEYKTPRERFLEEKENIKKAVQPENSDLIVTDEEVDELESEMQKIDKSMGDERHPITHSEYEEDDFTRLEQIGAKNVRQMQAGTPGKQFTHEERSILQALIEDKEEITDPVLKYLIEQKLLKREQYTNLKNEVKQLNEKITEQLTKASTSLMGMAGVLEDLDRQILEYVERAEKSV